VQQVMRDLRSAGCEFVPEPLGIDDEGWEIVAYVEGDVGVDPMPEWVWDDRLLVDIAGLLRRLHDVSASLERPLTGWRRGAVAPAEVICHSDAAPYNAVCRNGRIVALIDWDYAVPAPRGWDLGYAAYRWVTLTAEGHPDGPNQTRSERDRRLHLFCEAYGGITAHEVVQWARVRLEDLAAMIREGAAHGQPVFVANLADGHADLYEADAAWLSAAYRLDA
jgi:aminoglycoside phosphotransferase (APT) family kinase protein